MLSVLFLGQSKLRVLSVIFLGQSKLWVLSVLFLGQSKGPSIKDVRTRGGRGVSQKRTHADAGGRGVSGKKRTSSNSNFYLNFCSSNGVLCAIKQHLTQRQSI